MLEPYNNNLTVDSVGHGGLKCQIAHLIIHYINEFVYHVMGKKKIGITHPGTVWHKRGESRYETYEYT